MIAKNVLGFKSGEHLIFYRIASPQEVEVVRILNGRMDLKNQL